MTLAGRKWTLGTYTTPYECFTNFTPRTESERRAMSGFRFEKTWLQWNFGITMFEGREYCHAWTEGGRDLLVPWGQTWYIGATSEDKARYAREKAAALEAQRQARLRREREAAESRRRQEKQRRAALEAQRQAHLRQEAERLRLAAVSTSQVSVSQLQQVVPVPQTPTVTERFEQLRRTVEEAAESTGRVVSRLAEEFATAGGVQNRDDYQAGRITEAQYHSEIARDVAEDAVISGIGATLGGGLGGTAGALASGGTMAMPSAQTGAVLGAATTYTAVRATRAIGRTAHAMSSSSSGGGRGDDAQSERRQQTSVVKNDTPRIQKTKTDADNYMKGLTDQKDVLLNRGKTRDGHHYYEVMKKVEYKGNKFKPGEYLSRDTEKHEIEWFRDKDYHKGALDPVTGILKPNSRRANRILKIK